MRAPKIATVKYVFIEDFQNAQSVSSFSVRLGYQGTCARAMQYGKKACCTYALQFFLVQWLILNRPIRGSLYLLASKGFSYK